MLGAAGVLVREADEEVVRREVVLLNGYVPECLPRGAFRVVLLDVPDDELLRRHDQRLREEGWTNVEWFDWNREHLRQVRADGWVDDVLDGTRPPEAVAADVLALLRG